MRWTPPPTQQQGRWMMAINRWGNPTRKYLTSRSASSQSHPLRTHRLTLRSHKLLLVAAPMSSNSSKWEVEPSPNFLFDPRGPIRPKRHKENRTRRTKKKLRVDGGTSVRNYFTDGRQSDSYERVPQPVPQPVHQPVPQSLGSMPEPNSDMNSSEAKSLLKKSELSYSVVFLEFNDSNVDRKFQKYLSYYHSFYTVLYWVALPYALLNVSIFSVNLGTFFMSNTPAIVVCSVLQAINLLLLAAYVRTLHSIRSDLGKKVPSSAPSLDDLNRIEIASSPHFQHSLFQEISNYDDQQALSDDKAILLSRLAAALATATLTMISAWSILISAYSECPGFCVNNVPTFGEFFMWMIPLHFSVFTTIRGVPLFLLEIISKFLAYCAFSIQMHEIDIANYVVYVVITSLLWLGFWLPVLYSWNFQQLLHFHDIEAFRRVVAHYEVSKKPIPAVFDIFDWVESPEAVNDNASTNQRFTAQTSDDQYTPQTEEMDRIQTIVLEKDDEECFVWFLKCSFWHDCNMFELFVEVIVKLLYSIINLDVDRM